LCLGWNGEALPSVNLALVWGLGGFGSVVRLLGGSWGKKGGAASAVGLTAAVKGRRAAREGAIRFSYRRGGAAANGHGHARVWWPCYDCHLVLMA
jgi:hypothetical protein